MRFLSGLLLALFLLLINRQPAWAQEAEDIKAAEDLTNPIAEVNVLTFLFDQNWNFGPEEDGSVGTVTFIPRFSFRLGENWYLKTRTILPFVWQNDLPVKGVDDTGLSDMRTAQYLSPARLTQGGWIWGAGPVWLFPTASKDVLGLDQWAVGPSAGAFRYAGPWIYGMLVDHFWSFAGPDDREVNLTILQPQITFVAPTLTSFTLSTDATYDWESEQWLVPLNFRVSQLMKIGGVPLQFGVGARYWLDSPDFGPEGWGLRAQFSVMLP
ncbi:MAG: hypothetical protein R2940_07495 [Syntrophotaleaceae bacterium]